MIQETFASGRFLSHISTVCNVHKTHSMCLKFLKSGNFANSIESLSKSENFRYMGPISKMIAKELECAANCSSRKFREEGGDMIGKVAGALEEMSAGVEKDWPANRLVQLDENNVTGEIHLHFGIFSDDIIYA